MTPFVTAGAGFPAAVLWFDLMHDVQVLGRGGDRPPAELPDPVLASISGYYRRVTTDARPMNRLVAAAMLATTGALATQIARGGPPAWMPWIALGLIGSAIILAAARTVPSAVRLGAQADAPDVQRRLARSVCHDHLYCLGVVGLALTLELTFGR